MHTYVCVYIHKSKAHVGSELKVVLPLSTRNLRAGRLKDISVGSRQLL